MAKNFLNLVNSIRRKKEEKIPEEILEVIMATFSKLMTDGKPQI